MKCVSSISPYQGSARRTVTCLTWLGADGDPAFLRCLGIAENKGKSGTLLLQHQRTSSATDRHYREQEITNSWRRNLQTSNWKIHTYKPEKLHSAKGFRGLQCLLRGWLVKVFPVRRLGEMTVLSCIKQQNNLKEKEETNIAQLNKSS